MTDFNIQIHGSIVEFGIKLKEWRSAAHGAGVVQQNVEPAQLLCGLFHNTLSGARNAEVAPDGHGLAAVLPYGGTDGFGGFGIPVVVNGDICSEPAEFEGCGGPDTDAGAGHQNSFSAQVFKHEFFL